MAIPIPENSVNEGGCEVLVLVLGSEGDSGDDSDVEVMTPLTRGASLSSSAASQAFPDAMGV